jgi:hypothetical protein
MGARDAIAKLLTGIKAYHSSPHDFDRFDLSKIGTGEGAQVYGHGLYFAENPAVSGQGGQYWKQFLGRFKDTPEGEAARELMQSDFDRAKATGFLERDLRSKSELGLDPLNPAYAQTRVALERLRSGNPVGPRTYEVNIKADPARFLDWDKHLSQQSEYVRDALGYQDRGTVAAKLAAAEAEIEAMQKRAFRPPDASQPMSDWYASLFKETPETKALGELVTQRNKLRDLQAQAGNNMDDVTGNLLYGRMAREQASKTGASYFDKPAASQALGEAGIPGIKYLDQGSRNARPAMTTTPAGDVISSAYPPPTSNYVVFDPGIVDIMKKYGVVGAPAGALTMGAAYDQSQYEAPP